MNLIGEKVTHMSPNGQLGKYGDGIIVNTRGMNVPDYIHVKFDHEENEKVFPFPECFDRYLLMNDSDLADQIRKMKKLSDKELARLGTNSRVFYEQHYQMKGCLDNLEHYLNSPENYLNPPYPIPEV